MFRYCGTDIIRLHDDRVTAIFLQIIYKLSDSRKLTMPYIARRGLGPVGEKIKHPSASAFKCLKYSWIFIMHLLYHTEKKVIYVMYFEQLPHNYTLWTDLNTLLVRLS